MRGSVALAKGTFGSETVSKTWGFEPWRSTAIVLGGAKMGSFGIGTRIWGFWAGWIEPAGRLEWGNEYTNGGAVMGLEAVIGRISQGSIVCSALSIANGNG